MDIQIKVGQTVRRRDGKVRRIDEDRGPSSARHWRFVDDAGASYAEDGSWSEDISDNDIVEIISEPADCVTKELRDLAAHVTKEFAELHERIAKLERRPISSDDPIDNAIPILDINGEVIRDGDICELVLSKCRMVAKFDIDGDHWFESVVAKERMSADDFPALIVNGEQRYKAVKRIGVSPEWDGRPGSPGDPFAVDWSVAPPDATAHVFDEDGTAGWLIVSGSAEPAGNGSWNYVGDCPGETRKWRDSAFFCKRDDWRQSLRRRPEPEFKRGDRVMVRDSDEQEWRRRYYTEPGDEGFPHRATGYGPWAFALGEGVGYRFCRHPTPDELEGY